MIELKPNDLVVLKVPFIISDMTKTKLEQKLAEVFKEQQILILDNNLQLEAYRRS